MGILRVLLALSVVLAHLGGVGGYQMAGGLAAVQTFYIISGFYMATILTEKYDPRADQGVFYFNRFLRIYSIYFVCLAISLVLYFVMYLRGSPGWWENVGAAAARLDLSAMLAECLAALLIFGQDVLLFFKFEDGGLVFTANGINGVAPEDQPWMLQPIPQAWTIALELMFYLIVPFLIRLKTRTLIAIIALSLLARVLAARAGYGGEPWIYRFFPFELALFVIGMVARRIYDAHLNKISREVQIGLSVLFVAASLLMQPLSDATGERGVVIWVYYVSALVCLPCLFHLTRNIKIDNAVANFSYPIYLIHWIVMIFYDSLATGFGVLARVVICVAATLAISWLIVVAVEVPIDRIRQRRIAAAKGARV
jgi:peptidoglycan/LPS O-acetylase OafA/YrhL